jgi:pimeloyl-ACP methyl ester carboxylesterase
MTPTGGTHVYLLRGWLDVFSTGMDDLTVKLNRRGIRASVHGHVEYHALADTIAARYRAGRGERVVIIGHSLGANAAVEMAARLGELKVPVPLVITYDPTVVEHAPANVSRLVNFYQSNNGWGARVVAGPGFRGSLSNIDLARNTNLDHVSIDKSNSLHMQSIGYIQSLGGGRHATAPKPAPSSASDTKEAAPSTTSSDAKETAPASSQAPASVPDSSPPL